MGKRKGDHRWLWTVVCTFGMLSFVPFIWAAIQVRTKSFRTAAIVTSLGSAAAFVSATAGGLFEAAEQSQKLRDAGVPDSVVEATVVRGAAWAYWVLAALWLGSSLYALYLNPEYVRWRAGRLGSQGVGGSAQHIPPAPLSARVSPAPLAPTAQITNNFYGGSNNVNAQATAVQSSGNVTGINSGKIEQTATSTGFQAGEVLAFIDQYRAALVELDYGSRQAAEAQLDQLAVEMTSDAPDEAVVSRHLHTLRALAHHAVASGVTKAAAVAGSALMSTLLGNWPF